MTAEVVEVDDEARSRNEAMVDQLRTGGSLHDPAVEAAFRSVARHHFLPTLPLDDVYEDAAIPTKTGPSGQPLSSSSQPAIMAVMLEQLRPLPGQRVLEVGAGTGYNAGILAHLVGSCGRVVSLDYDEDICETARHNLAGAGLGGVDVIRADGARGWDGGAPYDRIILTVGADDVAPAWFDQLAPQGRLVLPLLLTGPIQLCVGFCKRDGRLESDTVTWCGFLPLRGELAPASDPAAQGSPLVGDPRESGFELPEQRMRGGFEPWLALSDPTYVRLTPDPADPPTFGLRDTGGLAVVGKEDEGAPILIYGSAQAAAERLAAAYRHWAQQQPAIERLRVAALRNPADVLEPSEVRVFRRRHFTFLVRWP